MLNPQVRLFQNGRRQQHHISTLLWDFYLAYVGAATLGVVDVRGHPICASTVRFLHCTYMQILRSFLQFGCVLFYSVLSCCTLLYKCYAVL